MKKIAQTPSQTVGPFFAYCLTAEQYGYDFNSIVNDNLTDDDTPGQRIQIVGQVLDGEGNPISDAMIELWQADPQGNYRTLPIRHKNDGFTGFGRLGTGTTPDFSFTFKTLKPGAIQGQAPHINVILFMRGSLHRLNTRIYFSDEDNTHDPLLNELDATRRNTLIAQRSDKNGNIFYRFDIRMQGDRETVFFGL